MWRRVVCYKSVYISEDVGDFLPDCKAYLPGDTTPYSHGTENPKPHNVKLVS
jgi:hypothetical protein